MYSAFHSTRLVIRAILISSLLVFGHIFTLISSSRGIILHAPPDFEPPIKQMSALVSATILWLSFTLLELVDVVEDADQGTPLEFLDVEEGEIPHERKSIPVVAKFKAQARPLIGGCQDLCIFFCRTEVELGIGLTLLTEWSVYWKQALYAVFCPIPVSPRDQVLLKGSYAVILLGLSALSLQLLVSLALHLLSNGYSSLREDVWGARTGQWACRGMIKLDDEQAGWVKELEEA